MEEILCESMLGVNGINGCAIYASSGNVNALILGYGFLTITIVGFAFTILTCSGYGRDIMNTLREHKQNRMNAELHEARNEPMRPLSNDNTLYQSVVGMPLLMKHEG